ncbi:MAG: phosphotransferase family protein [Anaerolineales bacterium]|nr:phosphotransferase family protein [Anaerolineales bacterium]
MKINSRNEYAAALEPILMRIPGWAGAESLRIERIAGLTNTNYRISLDGEDFVLRVSGENTQRLGINRQQEAKALKAAAERGLGPQVYAFLLPEGHLVTRWIEGRHWEPGECRTPQNIRLLTETVKRVHEMPPSGAVFSPFRRVEAYIETARGFGLPFPAGFEAFSETMRAVETAQQGDHSAWQRFCHNDLVAVNYLYSEQGPAIKILDWEFSGWGDIYYDLATVVYTHDSEGPIPPELEAVMLECYFGEVTPQQQRRLDGMKYMLMLFTGMWGLAQHGMQSAGLIPAVVGFDYLEFAQYLFAHDIPVLQRAIGGSG